MDNLITKKYIICTHDLNQWMCHNWESDGLGWADSLYYIFHWKKVSTALTSSWMLTEEMSASLEYVGEFKTHTWLPELAYKGS